jgi:hypothetical protein
LIRRRNLLSILFIFQAWQTVIVLALVPLIRTIVTRIIIITIPTAMMAAAAAMLAVITTTPEVTVLRKE